MVVLSFDYHDPTIGWPPLVMCTGIAGRDRKHRHKSTAQMATRTNKGEDSRSPATALAEVIAGIVLAGGAEKTNVGPVERERSTCMNKRGGGLLVVGIGTAGVKLAGGTKRVTAAKPEALEPKE